MTSLNRSRLGLNGASRAARCGCGRTGQKPRVGTGSSESKAFFHQIGPWRDRPQFEATVAMARQTSTSSQLIELAGLESASTEVSSRSGSELLCSYNVKRPLSDELCVPGAPPAWTPLKLPVKLLNKRASDAGPAVPADSTDRSEMKYLFEHLFQALSVMSPTAHFKHVDLVANRFHLQKLLLFISGRMFYSFTMRLHLVGSTLLLLPATLPRTDTTTTGPSSQPIPGSRQHEPRPASPFLVLNTQPEPGLEQFNSHMRAIRYRIGALNCVVSFHAGASYRPPDSAKDPKESALEQATGQDGEDVRASFAEPSLAGSGTAGLAGDAVNGLSVLRRGHIVPASALAEFHLDNVWQFKPKRFLQQLWLARIPHLLVGRHKKGEMVEVKAIDAAALFPQWEVDSQVSLRKLATLIGRLREMAKEAKDGTCLVIFDAKVKPRRLEVLVTPEISPRFPEELLKRFWPDE